MSVCDVDPASDELTEENCVSFLISGICTNTLEMPLSKCRSHVRLLIVVIQFRYQTDYHCSFSNLNPTSTEKSSWDITMKNMINWISIHKIQYTCILYYTTQMYQRNFMTACRCFCFTWAFTLYATWYSCISKANHALLNWWTQKLLLTAYTAKLHMLSNNLVCHYL